MDIKTNAEITTEQILKLILAVGVVVLLAILFWKLISPSFNKNEETAKSYFATLTSEIAKPDSGETGSFMIWENKKMFMVYFGDKMLHAYSESEWGRLNNNAYEPDANRHLFFAGAHDSNYICICYDSGGYEIYENNNHKKTLCSFCASLNLPARLLGWEGIKNEFGPWALKRNDEVQISKEGGFYVFKKS